MFHRQPLYVPNIFFFLNVSRTLLTLALRASQHPLTDAPGQAGCPQESVFRLFLPCLTLCPAAQRLFHAFHPGERRNAASPMVINDAIKIEAAEANGTVGKLEIKEKGMET